MNIRKWQSFIDGKIDDEIKFDPTLSLLNENVFDGLDLTHLTENEINMLMEGRKSDVIKKYKNIIDEHPLEVLINFDEQYNYKHLAWMAKEVASSSEKSWEQTDHADTVIGAVSDYIRFKDTLTKKSISNT